MLPNTTQFCQAFFITNTAIEMASYIVAIGGRVIPKTKVDELAFRSPELGKTETEVKALQKPAKAKLATVAKPSEIWSKLPGASIWKGWSR